MPHALKTLTARFGADKSGQIVIIFAFACLAIFIGLGAGIDLSRAYSARQRLSEVATLACQYSTRPSVAQTGNSTYSGPNGFQTYLNAVNAFATSSLTTQKWGWPTPTAASGAPAGSYFTATAPTGGTSATATSATNPVVEMSAAIPTAFAKIVNVNQIVVHTKINCQTLASTPQIVNPPTILQEGFETPCSGFCAANPSGGSTFIAGATNAFPAGPGYIGYTGYKWYIVGYCLETDYVGVINATVPEGTHAAELDCDNGSGSKGNSSISTSIYLEAGQYELRYNYRSRIDYRDYDPAYICGSTAADVSWANNTNVPFWSTPYRTNQINVYLDQNIPGTNGTVGSAPLHQTLDGTQYLAGSNLIDMCVYSKNWIERSIRVKVTTPGYYWLSFAADGGNDSYGGQLDNIRFCQEKCTGTLQDNFPPSWLAANNGGVNKVLFEDQFESPTYSPDYSNWIAKSGNMNNSAGVTVATAGCDWYTYPSPPGWPCQQTGSGWITTPYNQVNYILQGAQQGSQYIALDGYNGYSTGSLSRNRSVSKPFLLDPGYYQVSYNYVSDVNFTSLGNYGVYCTAAPYNGFAYPALGGSPYPGYIRFYQSASADIDTNIMGVFMSNGQLVSTPVGGGSLGATTSYNNPDGTVSTTATAPLDNINWLNYDAAANNPLLDTCANAYNFQWVPRAVYVKITKPGLYWLTFSANGSAADGNGAGIDDVKLIALGSPYMSGPPSSPLVAIPVPAPQPDTSFSPGNYAGYTIVADPFTPPGADQ